ncbi:MAG: hypothetical protein IT295_02295 [Dehalococcoidia bacterium]|nr:hypothetical protein [Dehalococcoidia bacterium]
MATEFEMVLIIAATAGAVLTPAACGPRGLESLGGAGVLLRYRAPGS